MDIQHIQLVAIDLDGTLLNSKKICSLRTQNAVQAVLKTGRKVCFVTGRGVVDTAPFAQQCGLSEHLITANGAYIWDIKNQQVIKQTGLDSDIVDYTIQMGRSQKMFLWLFAPHNVHCETSNYLYQAVRNKYPDFTSDHCNLDTIDNKSILKSLFILQQDKALEIKEHLHQKYGDRIHMIINSAHTDDPDDATKELVYLEILHSDSNKGNALQYLCEFYKIPLANTLAFGDEDNDIEMLQVAGVSVSMGNAKEHIHAIAQHKGLTNDEDGIADFLEKYLL